MPSVSKSQNRFWHFAEEHPEEAGVKKSVADEFLAADHGRSLKNLPEHVAKKAEGGAVAGVPKPFKW